MLVKSLHDSCDDQSRLIPAHPNLSTDACLGPKLLVHRPCDPNAPEKGPMSLSMKIAVPSMTALEPGPHSQEAELGFVALDWCMSVLANTAQALKAGLLSSSGIEAQEAAAFEMGDCSAHVCSDGWVPKSDHHELEGSNDAQCCEKTCELWTCGPGYVGHAKYAKNVGSSNEQCCDKTCAGFSCPAQFKVSEKKSKAAGRTEEECCEPTCSNVTCMPNYVKVKANADKLFAEDDAQNFCCEATCATHICDESQGLAVDPKKLHLTDVSDQKCCGATCSAFSSCPDGYAVPASKENVIGSTKQECCEPLCSAFHCSPGWKPDPVKATANEDVAIMALH
eukprot:s1768_g15.t1